MKRTNKHNTHKKIYISLISISLFMMSFLYLFYFKDNFSVFNDQNKPEKKITDYTINVHFLEKEKKLYGKESINFFNNYNKPLNKLVFHLYAKGFNNKDTAPSIDQDFENSSTDSLGNIKIKSVHIDNKSINFTTNNQILKISLTPLLKPKKNLKIDIDFELTIPNGRDRLGYFNDQYSITNWYPILSIFDEKTGTWDENSFYKIGESNHSSISNYCINLTVPKNMIVVSSGKTISETPNNETKKLNIICSKSRDFVLFMSPYYKKISKKINNTTINSYYLEYNKESEINKDKKGFILCPKYISQRLLSLCMNSFKYFNEKFGSYNYTELNIVESYLTGGAMEYPQVIQMGNYTRIPIRNYSLNEWLDTENLICPLWIDEAIVHETAHQWWYSMVGNNEFKEPFLDESLAEFSTRMFFKKNYQNITRKKAIPALTKENFLTSPPISSSVNHFNNWRDYSQIIYNKGALLLESLTEDLGEEKVFTILNEYFYEHKYKIATIKDFLDIVEKNSNKKIRKKLDLILK